MSSLIPDRNKLLEFKKFTNRFVEMYVWILIAIIVGGRALILLSASTPENARFYFEQYYSDIAITALVVIFPFMFKLIFGKLPFEFLRSSRSSSKTAIGNLRISVPDIVQKNIESINSKSARSSIDDDYAVLYNFALQARRRASGIYDRAGVYLLVGVIVAFSGLLFFYSLTLPNFGEIDIYQNFILILPKFGILFFIEFIAFFFLKQYRSAMDEFRYYDAIARVREEVLALLQISASIGKQISPIDLIKYDAYFSHGGILANGQSTELLEAKKLEGSELETINKLVDILAKKT